MAKKFSKTVSEWAKTAPEKVAATRARAVELLAEKMQQTVREGGKVPFRTGNLANSLLASTDDMPPTAKGPFTGSNVGLVAATLRADQGVYLGYQAKYARRMNSGFVGADSLGRVYNFTGFHFVEAAVAQWPNIVKQANAEVSAR